MNEFAYVAKIDSVHPIQGADKIQTAIVLGEQVVVSKDWEVGMIGLFFPPDVQLSHEFCKNNNLYRDAEKNVNPDAKGFFDNNRRVRCQPFLKVRSEGFFCELKSLEYTGADAKNFKLGDKFKECNGEQVCTKYLSEKTRNKLQNIAKSGKKKKLLETPMFHKHVDTEQFKYYVDKIPAGSLINIHAKVHGTSARYSYTQVVREPETLLDKVKDFFGKFECKTWEYIAGTRNVTLYESDADKQGFHGSEQYRFDILDMLKPYLEKGMTVYGEIAGYANGKPIMAQHNTNSLKDKKFKKKYGETIIYKYGCMQDSLRFHVYRISMTNEDGIEIDFTDDQVVKWCEDRGLLAPVRVCEPFIYDGSSEAKDSLKNTVEELTERPDVLTEDYIDPSHVSEGVIIRVDKAGLIPVFYKSKSYVFRVMEGIAKEDEVDIEDAS